MNSRLSIIILLCTILIWGFSSCTQSSETRISKHYDTQSHNNGRNCMDCHYSGNNNYAWAVAGSCYDSNFANHYPNATIKFFTESNGAGLEVASIEVDGKGNFYTTQNVKFGLGLYPLVIGTTGKKLSMHSMVTSGACGSCHNHTTCKICVK